MLLFIIVQNKHMVELTSIKVALFYSPSYRHVVIIIVIMIITCLHGKPIISILPYLFNNAERERYMFIFNLELVILIVLCRKYNSLTFICISIRKKHVNFSIDATS